MFCEVLGIGSVADGVCYGLFMAVEAEAFPEGSGLGLDFSFPLVGYFWDTCLGEDASGFADGEFFLEVQGVLSGIFGGGLFLFEDGVHAPAIQFLFPEVVDFGFCFDELGYYFWVMAEWERGSFEVALRFFGDCLAIGWVVFGGDFGDSFFELRLDFFLERFLLRS